MAIDPFSLKSVHVQDFEPVPPEVLSSLPAGLVTRQMIIPLSKSDKKLLVAVPKTEGVVKPEGLMLITGCAVEFVLAPAQEIVDFINRHYVTAAPVNPDAVILQQSYRPPSEEDTLSIVIGNMEQDASPEMLSETAPEKSSKKVLPPSSSKEPAISDLQTSDLLLTDPDQTTTAESLIDEELDLDARTAATYYIDPTRTEELPLIPESAKGGRQDGGSKSTHGGESPTEKIKSPLRDAALPAELVDILKDAVLNRATEVWLTQMDGTVQMRQRIRGTFIPVDSMGKKMSLENVDKLVRWVKDSGDRHQTESVSWSELRKEVSLQEETYSVHCFLTETKESRVLTLHIHSQKEAAFSPSSWGMDPSQIKTFTEFLERKQGFLLFAGSEPEGLTQNVHACARHLATPKRHVVAVEPFLESWLSGVDQYYTKGNPKLFTPLLKMVFKHAPDVVVVNPLEKKEHFEIAMAESLKGRLVIGRSYAVDSADALVQLASMGVEPYLVASALMGVISKRTLRLNCPACQTKDPIGRSQARELGITDAMQPPFFYLSKGCDSCQDTGFSGETDIFEILVMTNEIRNVFNKNVRVEEIRAHIKSNGLLTLRQVAIHKAINGQTSLAEVVRTTPK